MSWEKAWNDLGPGKSVFLRLINRGNRGFCVPGPVPHPALPCFCSTLPGIPGGGHDCAAQFTDEESEDDSGDACLAHPASWCRADVVTSLHSAHLHSPGVQSGGAALHTFLGHLELLSRQVSIHAVCLVFPWAVFVFIFFISLS